MKTTTFTATAIALLLAATASADEVSWEHQAPRPADVDLHGVEFITPLQGFITGADNLFMQTTDGGATWNQISSVQRDPQFSEDPIWDIQFLDDNNGFAAGNNIYRTTNGGQTWQALASQGTVYEIDMLTPQVGYMRSNLFIIKTTNGGNSWNLVWDWQNFDPVTDIDFMDEQRGLVAGSRDDLPGVFRTLNGGASFERISNQALSHLVWIDDDTVVGAHNGTFYRSTDGGTTWTQTHQAAPLGNNAMESLRRIDDNSLAAIDINLRIWISDDLGETWTRTFGPHGNWGWEWDIRFVDGSVGFAVGRLGMIYKSTDGGHSWMQISNGAAADINDIVVQPNGVGVAVGRLGTILRTSDYGQHWTLLPQVESDGFSIDLESVEAIDDNTFVTGGRRFLRSDDAGLTWTLGGILPGDINDISFINENEGWIFGSLTSPWGYISQTLDGGQTWFRVPDEDPLYPATEGKVMPSGRGWSLFPQTQQVITDDGFHDSFIFRNLPSGDSWQDFDFATENTGWYGGFYGGVLRTTNGGFIYEAQVLPDFRYGGGGNTDRITDVKALSENEAYISILKQGAIYDGVIYQTTNGGDAWTPLPPIRTDTNQFGGAISVIHVQSADRIWALGSRGHIFASDDTIPQTPADLNGDGLVDVTDLLELLGSWGACEDCATCPADLDGNCAVDVTDLLDLLAQWR